LNSDKCNRLRVTARDRLKLCLLGEADLPLELASPAAVAQSVRQLIGGNMRGTIWKTATSATSQLSGPSAAARLQTKPPDRRMKAAGLAGACFPFKYPGSSAEI
jgi:hypothetical protein